MQDRLSRERWSVVSPYLDQALELTRIQRLDWLASLRRDDPTLADDVEGLLQQHDDLLKEGFLEGDSPLRPTHGDGWSAPTVPGYRVSRLLGEGGAGQVFLAEDETLGRTVAIKVLPEGFGPDPKARERFLREARTMAAIQHPRIVHVYGFGEAEGRLYLVMEHVEGESLADLIGRTSPAPLDQALRILRQACEALEAAWEKGIIHRDIKPSNVLLDRRGDVKVADFGLAKSLNAPVEPVTHSGEILGSPHYMAPEQVRGAPLDFRTDMYALGILFFEVLTGTRPFEGSNPYDIADKQLHNPLPPLSEVRPDAPQGAARLVDWMTRKAPGERPGSYAEILSALDGLATGSLSPVGPRPKRRRLLALALAAAGAAIAAVAFDIGGWRQDATINRPPAIRSIAVLPLENLSGDAEQEYFTEGMTDALIGNLSKVGALRVISRTSTMRYKGAKAPLPQIARELSVDAVVEGSVWRSGQRVRINARLSHAPSDRSLWAESYERDLVDVLALQRELARAITQEIRVNVTRDERARLAIAPAVDPEVYHAYLKGLYHLKWNEKSLREALEHFQEALRRDPTYAPAYVGMANCYNSLGTVHLGRPPRDIRPLAAAAAQRALALDEGLAEAHAALASTRLPEWHWTAAEQGFRRAIQLNPSAVSAHVGLSNLLLAQRHTDEALAEARRAQEIDPLSPWARVQVAYVLLNGRRYDEAIQQYRSVIELDPTFALARWFQAVSYAEKGLFPEAIAQLQGALETSGRNPAVLGSLGAVYARSGRRAEALALLEELTALSKRGYVTPAAFVFLYTGLGDKDRAFEWLEEAARERSNLMLFLAVYPPLDPLRSDPRFHALLRRVGLPSPEGGAGSP
jgi:eukaryotic-like serine/threonine-protein kinase